MSANTQNRDDRFAKARATMVEEQLSYRGIYDPRVLQAMGEVPRDHFVDDDLADSAYADQPLPIGFGQTVSQPYIVALMAEFARIGPEDSVLEVGAGSGYAAAVLGKLARSVIAIERVPDLAERARNKLAELGIDNVRVIEGDGTLGWPEGAPYDAIIAAASGRDVPLSFLQQLSPGGRVVMPIGAPGDIQSLIAVTRQEDGTLERRELGQVRFVPLVGKQGWGEQA
jgi:protein-L-isoaspartate(D-aspartate) O-methyltransferase